MLFSEGISILRSRFVGELDSNFYSDIELLSLLIQASEEIAAVFKFPQVIHSGTIAASASTVAPPADMLTVELGQVMVGGLRVRPADFVTIQDKLRLNTGLVEVYYYDPRRASTILLAPAPTAVVPITFEYTKMIYTNDAGAYTRPTSASQIWGTSLSAGHWTVPLFPNFHHVPVYLAGVMAFEMSQEQERASYYQQRFADSARMFGAFLNQTDLANLLISREQRNDPGPKGN